MTSRLDNIDGQTMEDNSRNQSEEGETVEDDQEDISMANKLGFQEFGERRGDRGGYWDPDSMDELETASLSRDSNDYLYFDSSGYEQFPESNKGNHSFDSATFSAGSGKSNENDANDFFGFDNKDLELLQRKQPICNTNSFRSSLVIRPHRVSCPPPLEIMSWNPQQCLL